MTQVPPTTQKEQLPMLRKFWHQLGIFKEIENSEFQFSETRTSNRKANNTIFASAGDWENFRSELEFE